MTPRKSTNEVYYVSHSYLKVTRFPVRFCLTRMLLFVRFYDEKAKFFFYKEL